MSKKAARHAKQRDYENALKAIAGEVWVTYTPKRKKMYKRWRKLATERIDIARAVLMLWNVDAKP